MKEWAIVSRALAELEKTAGHSAHVTLLIGGRSATCVTRPLWSLFVITRR